MKRNGRSLAHNTLEEMRILAVQRIVEGELLKRRFEQDRLAIESMTQKDIGFHDASR